VGLRRSAHVAIAAAILIVAIGVPLQAGQQVPSGGWAATGEMSQPRWSAAAALLPDGRLLITGGYGGTGQLATAEIYAGGQFTACAPMLLARGGHTAVTLADGRVLVAGGTRPDGIATSAAEIYDPAANAWSVAGPMIEGRAGHTAALLRDGRVLIAGGQTEMRPDMSL